MKITYLTENPTKDYIAAIKKADSLSQLRTTISPFKNICDDAYKKALILTNADFKQFHKDWNEMKGAITKTRAIELDAKWGDIIMPRKLLFSTIIEDKFKVPWGTAFIRCEEEGWPWEK